MKRRLFVFKTRNLFAVFFLVPGAWFVFILACGGSPNNAAPSPTAVANSGDDDALAEPGDTNQQRSMVQRPRGERRGERREGRPPDEQTPAAQFPAEMRSITGMDNNVANPTWGSADIEFIRLAGAHYADGSSSPAGEDRVSAREVSNAVSAQSQSIANPVGASNFLWQWGQFLDHDIDETPIADPAEAFDIVVPAGDPWFDPDSTGSAAIALDRSSYAVVDGVREQVNLITAFIDASNVYGSDDARARALRSLDGSGRLLTSDGDLLPYNTVSLENAPSMSAAFFLAGDIRANEQVGLTAMHTVFLREHNFWADSFRAELPDLSGDEIYEYARAIVAGEMQAITYNEFLPILLGEDTLRPYEGYDPGVNPGIANEFATAAYRMGHSMLTSQLLRLDAGGEEIDAGHLPLAGAFFNPGEIEQHGVDALLRGLAFQEAQNIDVYVVDDVRNFLFGPPGAGGFDLVSLNIQRGRDHGLPTLNAMRRAFDLPAHASFEAISDDPLVVDGLSSVFDSADDVDLWVGCLAEDHVPGSLVGETCLAILRDQFERLRDGDRFWYRSYLPRRAVALIDEQTLARIIRRNTGIGDELRGSAFVVATDALPAPEDPELPNLAEIFEIDAPGSNL